MLRRRPSAGRKSQASTSLVADSLPQVKSLKPVTLDLGGAGVFTFDANGEGANAWRGTSSTASPKSPREADTVPAVEAQLRSEMRDLKERNNMLAFKLELALDMLGMARDVALRVDVAAGLTIWGPSLPFPSSSAAALANLEVDKLEDQLRALGSEPGASLGIEPPSGGAPVLRAG